MEEIGRAAPFAAPAGAGDTTWFLQNRMTIKATAEATGGAFGLVESWIAPGASPPLHVHHGEDEAFFVLEGTVRFEVDGDTVDAPAGGYARVPPGVVHRFSNPFDEPARFLGLLVPGGFEQYWVELSLLMADAPSWPPEDMGPVLELQAKYDTFPPPAPSSS
jgi:mannose-6-phosphate isomerase-like protein (cupin superfamily)